MPRTPDTDAFWQAFRRHAEIDHDNYVVGWFGDSLEMATELADLVVAGIKKGHRQLGGDYGESEPKRAGPSEQQNGKPN